MSAVDKTLVNGSLTVEMWRRYPPTSCRLSAIYSRTAYSLGRLLPSPSGFKDRKTLEISWIECTCPRQVSGHVHTLQKRRPYLLSNLIQRLWYLSWIRNPPACTSDTGGSPQTRAHVIETDKVKVCSKFQTFDFDNVSVLLLNH